MAQQPTSLKIPPDLKERIDRLARHSGESPHALMVRALAEVVESMERHQAFVEEARASGHQLQESGLGYDGKEVHDYIRARLAGRKVKRPKPVPWRG